MPSLSTFGVFLGIGLVILVTPGPAVLFVVARSLSQGRRAGLVSVLGLATGGLVHLLAAAAGVSAILMSSPLAFRVLQLGGAAYLVVLGIRRWRSKNGDGAVAAGAAPALESPGKLFREGFLVNLTNPKSALFLFAFLPQFVDPARGSAMGQMLALGLVFLALGFCTDAVWAYVAAWAGGWLRRTRLLGWQGRIEGGVYLGLGIAAAVSGYRR